ELCNYDVGLALEDKEADMNRNICLTNKIWAYFQAGLFILASNTDAQDMFLQEHAKNGINSALSETELAKAITTIIANKDEIRHSKQERFQSAMPYNWENECGILINKWAELSI
ncbi:MAG TPA: hypothetical protein VK705_05145, partial [Ferruginibacter sp.]|nr:hypothetical protein [Ferruginibacter sp.]